jgi:hypothetical protein
VPLAEQARAARERGLDWLAARQGESGAWRANIGLKISDGYIISHADAAHPGVSALAGLALLASEAKPHTACVGALIDYLRSRTEEDGLIRDNGSRMYSHAFALLFLGEAHAQRPNADLRSTAAKAADFTFKCQSPRGGWGYAPFGIETDITVTACAATALRAARDGGLHVPDETFRRAARYLLNSAHTLPDDEIGAFDYQWRAESPLPTRRSHATAAAGLAGLLAAGLRTDEEIERFVRAESLPRFIPGGDPLPGFPPVLAHLRSRRESVEKGHYAFWFGNLLAGRALASLGGVEHEIWTEALRFDLVRMQAPDGSWADTRVGPSFATACACLILEAAGR